jgi:hypothetical protein|nr:hypothetical protein [uncultured Oscillibacter sp.]DAZ27248.1 MAG TPA: hypothetical protein [Caudoviricetes sp.]
MEQTKTEQVLMQLDKRLDYWISEKDWNMARYFMGQIAGALALAQKLDIIDDQEHDQRFHALLDKFYDAF